MLLVEKLRCDERLIIVEGKEDRVSLERMGIDSARIIEVSKKPRHELMDVFEEKNARSVISFLDDDKAGKALLKRMKTWFPHVSFDESYSSKIYGMLHVSFAADISKAVERHITNYFF